MSERKDLVIRVNIEGSEHCRWLFANYDAYILGHPLPTNGIIVTKITDTDLFQEVNRLKTEIQKLLSENKVLEDKVKTLEYVKKELQ